MSISEIPAERKLQLQREMIYKQFSALCDEEFAKIEHVLINSANKLIDSMAEKIKARIEEKKGEAIAGVIIHLDKSVRIEDGVGVTTISIQKQ